MSVTSSRQNSFTKFNILKARLGFLLGSEPPNSFLDFYNTWTDWVPVISAGSVNQPITSSGTQYKRIGNNVHLNLNMKFVYDSSGAPAQTITVTGIPYTASTQIDYVNSIMVVQTSTVPKTLLPGSLSILPAGNPNAIIVKNDLTFADGESYTVNGALQYTVD